MRPELQERHHDYVLGPTQDVRLTSVAAGALIKGVTLQLDPDAPFVLRGRAVRQSYTAALTQDGLQFLRMRWAGPALDYRQQGMVPQSVEMANFGQFGNPKPVFPPVVYPANGLITVDLENTGTSAISNLMLFWRGVKLFPWGAVPAYTYPPRFASLAFSYPQVITALGVSELRQDNILTVRPDADFVLRSGQATAPFSVAGRTFAEVFIKLKDFNKKPYSNDFIPLDVLFGAGELPATIPLGPTPSFIAPFGPGPAQPGLFYPELYVPKNHQLLFDLKRTDGSGGSNQAEDLTIVWGGGKVFPR
jgi:hypothetical protein